MELPRISKPDQYHQKLADFLRTGQFEDFKRDLKKFELEGTYIDTREIPERFEILEMLLLDCIQRVSENYDTSALGDFIEIIRFFNSFHLLERKLNPNDYKSIDDLKSDNILMSNLSDLFGKLTNSLIIYVSEKIPKMIIHYFLKHPGTFFLDNGKLIEYIKTAFFNQYTIYGLSVKYLSTIEYFINDFLKFYNKNAPFHRNYEDFIEFEAVYTYIFHLYEDFEREEQRIVKKHLISPHFILKNKKLVTSKIYAFYNLSMVLWGGIGPQGHGFTYTTPRGEVIEICSDRKENRAIIIEYKKFLKEHFIVRLRSELNHLSLDQRNMIIDFLKRKLNRNELIGYTDYQSLVKEVKFFLKSTNFFENRNDFDEFIQQISRSIISILRPIKMVDQFKIRMNLVNKGKMKPEDIAKFTSLKEKSHYDVLRERLFFQYIVDWMYELYLNI